MLTKLGRQMVEHSENDNKDMENIRKYQREVTTELENTLEGFNSRLYEVEEWISELEDKAMEITQAELQSEKRL